MISRAREIQRRRAASGEEGFTLIELLIVIIVLGILAAIVVFALGGVTGQSAVAACNSDAKSVSIAVSAYQAQNNATVPPTIASLLTTAGGGPYLKSVPGNQYYMILLDKSGDVLVSLGKGVVTTGAVPLTAAAIAGLGYQSSNVAVAVGGDTFSAISTDVSNATSPPWKAKPSLPVGAPLEVIGALPQLYEGSNAFTWGTDTSVSPATNDNQNICSGA